MKDVAWCVLVNDKQTEADTCRDMLISEFISYDKSVFEQLEFFNSTLERPYLQLIIGIYALIFPHKMHIGSIVPNFVTPLIVFLSVETYEAIQSQIGGTTSAFINSFIFNITVEQSCLPRMHEQ